MGLSQYQHKRDFRKTPEPRGKRVKSSGRKLSFVIQKHDASHLHYDFRLEWDGVLKSWAVPKGPDLDPAVKRLAMQVEDHPLEYGSFEGIIPEGEYGGGTVMVWDRGTWEPVGDAGEGFREGRLKFELHGEKLRGGWMLVRRGGKHGDSSERHWFLFKERDEFAEPGESITEEKPLSVSTGRDLDEIAEEADRTWGANGEVEQSASDEKRKVTRRDKKTSAKKHASASPGRSKKTGNAKDGNDHGGDRVELEALLENPAVHRRRMPEAPKVELATLVEEIPPGEDWVHEIKFDGYRMICRLNDGKARFISRNDQDWSHKFPELVAAAEKLPVQNAILDGEVVALQPDGTTSFQALQNVFQKHRTKSLIYYVFDLLYLNGRDLTGLSLESRKEILRRIVMEDPRDSIRFSEHLPGLGEEIIDYACRLHLEGIVSKRRDSAYRPGRGLDWLKTKCSQREEFVIGGFTKPGGSRTHFGALLLGYYDSGKKLRYAGRVGTGFDAKTLADLHAKLTKLERVRSPFVDLSGSTGAARDVTWVKPVLVAEIRFSNWTDERLLRQPAFQGLREDKPATSVVHDHALSLRDAHASENGHMRAKQSNRREGPRGKAAKAGTVNGNGASAMFGHVRISHPDKVLYSEEGITKSDLANYYAAVADWMLPHVIDRPLAVVRCPGGSRGPCFFQKHPGEGSSEYLRLVDISKTNEPEYHVAIDDEDGLMALVQMGVLEIHVWGSTTKHLEKPDRLIFDLDPGPGVEWPDVMTAAKEVRDVLEDLELASFVKTTGGKGLHIVVPVQARVEWDDAKAFCRAVANAIVKAAPERYIATMSKAARHGKIFIDYLRNGRGATSVAPYSTRSRPGATVSVPLSWDELNAKLHPGQFTIERVPARLERLKTDPWSGIGKTRQSISAAVLKKLGR